MRTILFGALVVSTAACAGTADDANVPSTDGPPAEVSILPKAAYDSLPVMRLRDLGPLCRENTDVCTMRGFPVAAVSGSGDVLFFGSANRRPQIYRVDSQPARAIPVGRNGEGPGEYRLPWVLGFAPGGEVLVASPTERRLLRYSSEGAPLATSLVPMPPGLFTAALAGGELRALATELADEPGDSMPVVMFALDSGARTARRVYGPDLRAPAFAASDMRPMPPPFTPHPQWVISRDGGVLYSRSDRLVIDMYGPTGRHEHRVGFLVPPREVSADELADARTRSTRLVRDPQMREALEAYWKREGAKHHPAITRIVEVGGDKNQIWVRESPMAATDSVSWVIFDKEGRALGRVITGADDMVFAARRDSILMSVVWDSGPAGALRWVRLGRP